MKRLPRRLPALIAAAAAALLVSCASQPTTLPETISVGELFQRAQDQVTAGNYAVAISFYEQVSQRFPDDAAHGAWASYEIAFLYHRMGNDAKALPLLKDLLDRYAAAQAGTLPPGPQVLAQKLQARLQAAASKTPAAKAAPAAAEGTAGSGG